MGRAERLRVRTCLEILPAVEGGGAWGRGRRRKNYGRRSRFPVGEFEVGGGAGGSRSGGIGRRIADERNGRCGLV